jgi:hypothetical protein
MTQIKYFLLNISNDYAKVFQAHIKDQKLKQNENICRNYEKIRHSYNFKD